MNKLYLLLPALAALLFLQCSTTGSLAGRERADKLFGITVLPITHGSLVLQGDGHTIYIDPYGGAEQYAGLPAPDMVLITHPHGDHYHPETLAGLDLGKAELIAPQSVIDKMEEMPFGDVTILANGETASHGNHIRVEAVPMYNLPETEDSRHPKGWGNGYVISLDNRRIYISGDTEDIREMRQLQNIDIAFVCMNLPYTMTVEQAAAAVLEFRPRVVYPYHYRRGDGTLSDTEQFQALVNGAAADIEVRLRDWYPGR